MSALQSALVELRKAPTGDTAALLLDEECAALTAHIDRLHEAVLAAEDRPEGWSATVAAASAEIRSIESESTR